MKLIDIHAHLDNKRFEGDLDEIIERCRKKNVVVITSGVNMATNRRVLEIAEKYPDIVKVSFGIYPLDALANEWGNGEASGFVRDIEKFDVDEELAWIEENKDKCVAIGEIGLDYHWKEFQGDKEKEEQKKIFRKILKFAKKIDKTVVIHSRKAELEAIEILEDEKMEKVVMHSFNGKKSLIRRVVENGWFFSVPPVITRLDHFKMLVEMVPIEQLLTETDAPYLSPVAGERNESANVAVTVKVIAEIKGISGEEVAEKIWENAKRLGFV
ncbi:TatD family hydrolase [archaeon]|jgi:TatD DNase family protein|nr:TatD family hydrolase [archaeon]MBT3577724.1 TatD family hydrolase [archaeon]MBT6820731.1 TatD family hydrolase [archaeon]MBT6955897.1 TatD family hydrolase [archaeon]MBT7025871.1 TatD family hydrolase [archaeon]